MGRLHTWRVEKTGVLLFLKKECFGILGKIKRNEHISRKILFTLTKKINRKAWMIGVALLGE